MTIETIQHGTELAEHIAFLPTGETLSLFIVGTRYARIVKTWHDGAQERHKLLNDGTHDEMWAEFRSLLS